MVRSTGLMALALGATSMVAAPAAAAKWRARGSITGGLRRSGRWTGTFRVRLRVYVRGRLDTTCRIRHRGWKASPVS